MTKLLENRVAIVTGSGQGVGRAIALTLADLGCKVVTNNRHPGSNVNAEENKSLDYSDDERKRLEGIIGDAETTAAAIRERGGVAVPCFADVSKPEDCKKLVETAIAEFGRLDILVCNGASFYNCNIKDMPIDMWHKVVDSKLDGTFYLIHYAVPYMIEQGFGRILSASSEAFQGLMGMAPYSSAASGIWALTKTAAQDLRPYGITSNAYTPLCKTRGWYSQLHIYAQQGVPEEVLEQNAPKAMQFGPEGMGVFLAWLCSDEAADVTGLMFNIEASGKISIWSESQQYNAIEKDVAADGIWTIEEIREQAPKLLEGATSSVTTIELH
ncbi:MAG: SDR family NAD(P)-dependent oxidoreductase [Eggerthellaceae bacterium]|nr:SDR family NAD(P)-dependent oxidoreductase [Eggerthellaceae bacterium]